MKFDSPLAAFLHWEGQRPDTVFLRQPINGTMVEYTWAQAGKEARKVASYLNSLDLPSRSHVALMSKNCAHWVMADLAIMMAGHISVPLYPTITAEMINQILVHSESRAIFIGKLDDFPGQKSGIPEIPVISAKTYGEEEGKSWEEIVDEHEPISEIASWQTDELMSIIYTSGTTGKPKGVMHSVGAFSLVTNNSLDVLPLPANPRFFSYLPLSHIAERIIAEMGVIFRGGVVTFPESLETFAADLAAVQPHLFFGVPRIYAKFQEGVLNKMPQKKLDRLLSIPIINGIIRKKIRHKLGLSDAGLIYSGAAPLAISTMDWYAKLGITVMQGYGMTEDCILSHYNVPGANRVGSVGKPTIGVQAKLSPDGEICIKSDCLTMGYYKEPELTKELFDEDGYLRTGDCGEYDHDGYLFITGRVKDQFKTDKGKYISPSPIELELSKNEDIGLICIVGTGVPQPLALIVLSEVGQTKSKEEIIASLSASIELINPKLQPYEKIEKAVIMNEEWSVDNGLLTPTFKTKRSQIEKIHMHMYPQWYEQEGKVIWE